MICSMNKKRQEKYHRAVMIGNTAKPYQIRRSKRAKNILLHVDVQGRIEVVLPWRADAKTAEKFVKKKKAWIDKMLQKHQKFASLLPKRKFETGEKFPCFGQTYTLKITTDKRRTRTSIHIQKNTLHIATPKKSAVKPALVRWCRTKAKAYFTEHANRYAKNLRTKINSIRIGDTKSQWGSCSHGKKALSFNWRLALAPKEVCWYVIAHEVAHLRHPNHSPAFWKPVEAIEPNYEARKLWLRKYGYTLIF